MAKPKRQKRRKSGESPTSDCLLICDDNPSTRFPEMVTTSPVVIVPIKATDSRTKRAETYEKFRALAASKTPPQGWFDEKIPSD